MDWRTYIPHAIFFGAFFGLFLAGILIPLIRRRETRMTRDSVARAREHILAEGKVEGPTGPYVAHKEWKDAGTAHMTNGETKPPRHDGYYGTG